MFIGFPALFIGLVAAHGSKTLPEGTTWMSWHMAEEHQIDDFDARSFFTLHDLDGSNTWSRDDVLAMYGLSRPEVVGDGSGMGDHDHDRETITESSKNLVVSRVLDMIDKNHDGVVGIEEWIQFIEAGGELPDFGYGPGHHLDFEAEYEQHHWNKYHKDQDPNVLIKHKEDIEHELLHHEHEIEQTHDTSPEVRSASERFKSRVRLENLPQKFRNKGN